MSEAPERIFAWKSDIGTGAWISAHDEIIRKNETEYRRADLPPTDAECLRNEKVRELVIDCAASLAAAISLLERGGKKGAASDKMFEQMLKDYKASLDRARTALAAIQENEE